MTPAPPRSVQPIDPAFDASRLSRPAPQLFIYYCLVALSTLPGVVIALPLLWFRYLTLRYRFDDEGVSMRVGLLFKKEILLTYRRIQDIHLTRNIIQRWLGLATVSIQTASGSAGPEMKIEGILEAEQLRDYLYQKMRGAKGEPIEASDAKLSPHVGTVTELLTEIRDNLAQLNALREHEL
ncbi:MAG: PH domain-containing protein [Planctomycetales bacterium]|nr:PH domain-containing protein [Planctomycetales bacterium]